MHAGVSKRTKHKRQKYIAVANYPLWKSARPKFIKLIHFHKTYWIEDPESRIKGIP